MKTAFSKFALAAALALASAYTFSCSGDDGDNSKNPSGASGSYESVTIGSQVWMKKNLDIEAAGSVCYNNVAINCAKCGRLYTWEAALNACPDGWHLPSNEEWDALYSYADSDYEADYSANSGHSYTAGKLLKANSDWHDYEGISGKGTDDYGFAALPCGGGNSPGIDFSGSGTRGFWWSASETDAADAYNRYMRENSERASWSSYHKTAMYSVRCIKD